MHPKKYTLYHIGVSIELKHQHLLSISFVDVEGSHLTDPSSFLTICVPCSDARPEVSVLNPRQCPSAHHTGREQDEMGENLVLSEWDQSAIPACLLVSTANAVTNRVRMMWCHDDVMT